MSINDSVSQLMSESVIQLVSLLVSQLVSKLDALKLKTSVVNLVTLANLPS